MIHSRWSPPEVPQAVVGLLSQRLDPGRQQSVDAQHLPLFQGKSHAFEQSGVPDVIHAADHAGADRGPLVGVRAHRAHAQSVHGGHRIGLLIFEGRLARCGWCWGTQKGAGGTFRGTIKTLCECLRMLTSPDLSVISTQLLKLHPI